MSYGQDVQYGGFVWPRLTPGVKLLLIINVVVFFVNAVLRGALGTWLGVSWNGAFEGYGLGLLRLVSYQFVHSYLSAWHLVMNMLVLYWFGGSVEMAIGKRRLLRLYLISGVVGGVVQLLLGRVLGTSPDLETVGASGSVYGIMVYMACLAPRAPTILHIELRWLVGILVAIGAYSTYIGLVEGISDGVAHGGHLGGALWGYLAFKLPQRRWRWFGRVQSWQQNRKTRSQQQRQEIVDQLLDKVHKDGLGSLSNAERRFLEKYSQEMQRRR